VSLPPVPDLVEALADDSGRSGLEDEGAAEDDLPVGRPGLVLEPALAVGEAELGGGDLALGAVSQQDIGRFEQSRDVRAVRPGIGPDRAPDRARDREPELQPREPRLLRLGRGAGHRDAGGGHVAIALDPAFLGPDLDDQAANPAVGGDDIASPPEDQERDAARAGEPDQAAQLEAVVGDGQEIRGAADAHRRELREGGVAFGPDADAAGDVRGQGRDLRRRGAIGRPGLAHG